MGLSTSGLESAHTRNLRSGKTCMRRNSLPASWAALLALCLAIPSFAAVPPSHHVVLVMEENHSYSSVIGSTSMPYLNGLAQQYGLATQYYADAHYSIPNYFWITTGQPVTYGDNTGCTVGVDDCSKSGTPATFDVNNLVRQMLLAGKTWRAYAESLPYTGYMGYNVPTGCGPGTTVGTCTYVKRHNPFPYFTDVAQSNQKYNVVPMTHLAADIQNHALAEFTYIVPNLQHDAHNGSLGTADTWLKNNIGPLIASPDFQKDGILIITFDESFDTDTTYGGGHVATVIVGPGVKHGLRSTVLYQHQNVLRTISEALGLTTFLGDSAPTYDMGEFFTGYSNGPGLPPGSATVSISAPLNSSTVSSPMRVTATASSPGSTVTTMQVYLDGSKVYQVSGSSVDTSISATDATHRVTVQAFDSSNNVFKSTIYATVNATTPTVIIQSPTNSSTVSAPIVVSATAEDMIANVRLMQIYLDGLKVYQVAGSSLNTSLAAGTGKHRITVQAYDYANNVFKSTVYATVQ